MTHGPRRVGGANPERTAWQRLARPETHEHEHAGQADLAAQHDTCRATASAFTPKRSPLPAGRQARARSRIRGNARMVTAARSTVALDVASTEVGLRGASCPRAPDVRGPHAAVVADCGRRIAPWRAVG